MKPVNNWQLRIFLIKWRRNGKNPPLCCNKFSRYWDSYLTGLICWRYLATFRWSPTQSTKHERISIHQAIRRQSYCMGQKSPSYKPNDRELGWSLGLVFVSWTYLQQRRYETSNAWISHWIFKNWLNVEGYYGCNDERYSCPPCWENTQRKLTFKTSERFPLAHPTITEWLFREQTKQYFLEFYFLSNDELL